MWNQGKKEQNKRKWMSESVFNLIKKLLSSGNEKKTITECYHTSTAIHDRIRIILCMKSVPFAFVLKFFFVGP